VSCAALQQALYWWHTQKCSAGGPCLRQADRAVRLAAGLSWGGESEACGRGWQLADLLGGSVARVRSFARETTSSLLAASALLPPPDTSGARSRAARRERTRRWYCLIICKQSCTHLRLSA